MCIVNMEFVNSPIQVTVLKEYYAAECLKGFKNLEVQFQVRIHELAFWFLLRS